MEPSGPPRSQETWDGMLPGPPSRHNGGSADISPGGLLAYASGSSVVVTHPRSMQLLCVLPMPSPSPMTSSSLPISSSSPSLAPFVTSVRWSPHPFPRDLSSDDDPPLLLAVADRQSRIALWDLRSRKITSWLSQSSDSSPASAAGIQDLCWVLSDTWLLVSIHGPSLITLWNPSTSRVLWKYDASPEHLSCVRRDPYDSRHFCALGLRGFLLSAVVLSPSDVSVQEHRIPTDASDLVKLERDASLNTPALAAFPLYFARLCFSPRWRHVLVATFPKELVVFDLQYGTALSTTLLPRGCSKFMDLMPDPDADLLYCVHLDGKLSTWKRKE